jgi:hypothetical protein
MAVNGCYTVYTGIAVAGAFGFAGIALHLTKCHFACYTPYASVIWHFPTCAEIVKFNTRRPRRWLTDQRARERPAAAIAPAEAGCQCLRYGSA